MQLNFRTPFQNIYTDDSAVAAKSSSMWSQYIGEIFCRFLKVRKALPLKVLPPIDLSIDKSTLIYAHNFLFRTAISILISNTWLTLDR